MILFHEFGCDKMMLECIAALRLAIAKRKKQDTRQRETAYYFIKKYGGK